MRIRIHPYKMASRGAILIKETLIDMEEDALCVKHDGDYRPRDADRIVGWGAGDEPSWLYNKNQYLNSPPAVMRAINKLDTFRYAEREGVRVPHYTTRLVLARMNEGHDGAGLTIIHPGEMLPPAQFYTLFEPIKQEWRVHVFNGRVLVSQLKVPMRDPQTERDKLIRVSSSGWGLSLKHPGTSHEVRKAAIDTVKSLGLDFGGVDIGITENNHIVMLEVNTAPEMTLTTARHYANAIVRL
jgi:hypothetical protein